MSSSGPLHPLNSSFDVGLAFDTNIRRRLQEMRGDKMQLSKRWHGVHSGHGVAKVYLSSRKFLIVGKHQITACRLDNTARPTKRAPPFNHQFVRVVMIFHGLLEQRPSLDHFLAVRVFRWVVRGNPRHT